MGLHVLVDDLRDFGDIIIRNSEVALATLRKLHKSIESLSMDNDMGSGRPEGRQLLEQYMQDCANHASYPPQVNIVTGNSSAACYMRATLKKHGYQGSGDGMTWRRP